MIARTAHLARLRGLLEQFPVVGLICARPVASASRFSWAFEEWAAYLAQITDQTQVHKLTGVAWATVGQIIERVVSRRLSPERDHPASRASDESTRFQYDGLSIWNSRHLRLIESKSLEAEISS